MTTGRINQVTFLSERSHPLPCTHWARTEEGTIIHTKGAGASWRGFSDKRRDFCTSQTSRQGSLVFLKPPLRYSSYKAASQTRSVQSSTHSSRGFPKINVYCKLPQYGRAQQWRSVTTDWTDSQMCWLYVYPSGNHTDSSFFSTSS